AYITLNNYRDNAVKRGIHQIINYDGSIMTDSGGYQVLEYGKVDVDPKSMATFEQKIGTDLAIPLDRPTGFGLSKKKAKFY
ncbi:MAG: tRNA guanosine(15) transglycosylase TgtA, partial [Thaumarchaeota archaeon]